MQLIPLVCNQCGAPLEAVESANFITCGHCHTRLKVVRTNSSISTELIGEIHERTREMSADVRLIRLYRELDDLEKDWDSWRKHNDVRDLEKIADSDLRQISGGMVILATILVTLDLLFAFTWHWMFVLAAPVLVILLLRSVARSNRRIAQFRKSRDRYRDDVASLRSQIDELRRAPASVST